ncbi:hypothetical protein GF319_10690 [Candidatus Bathyarchaeota archaeon]|nr:hypothetical protein [Candidatus Bathyarchaeota archaeon]
MKDYTDLGANLEDPKLLDYVSELGFTRIASEKISEHPKIDVVSKLNITPKNPNFLLQSLKKYRWKYEVISVTCFTKSVARQAGRDHRVDTMKFPLKGNNFDYHQANLMKNTGSSLEIEIRHLLEDDPQQLERNIKHLGKQVRIARRHEIPIILTSGAYSKYQLRTPRAIIALSSLLEIEEHDAERMITETPNCIIDRNRERLSEKFVMPGVWLV